MSRYFQTIEGCVKSVSCVIESCTQKKDSSLEIELDESNSPVNVITCDQILPIEKGDYIRVQVDVTKDVELDPASSYLGYVVFRFCDKSRKLREKEKACVIQKIKNDEVVATYKFKTSADRVEEAYEKFVESLSN